MADAGESPMTDAGVRVLVIGDIHLRTSSDQLTAAELPVAEHDCIVSLGDVIDENRDHAPSTEAGMKYEQRGRSFFEDLDEYGVPVLAVPGNHDPVSCTDRLVDGLEHVQRLHRETATVSSDATGDAVTIAG